MLKLELRQWRPRLSATALPLLVLASAACSSQTVKLVQPQSGATAECSASGFGFGATWAEQTLGGCISPYESRGYVRVDRLTAEQRAELERRGLLPK